MSEYMRNTCRGLFGPRTIGRHSMIGGPIEAAADTGEPLQISQYVTSSGDVHRGSTDTQVGPAMAPGAYDRLYRSAAAPD